MQDFDLNELKKLYIPAKSSHKGQNGKLMIIGGSHLFHGASLWALKVASRIVDMVFYSSIPENIELTKSLKSEFYDFMAIPRNEIESYIQEADCVLLGPGMVRAENSEFRPSSRAQVEGIQNSELKFKIQSLDQINNITDEGEQTYYLTKYLLENYPQKKFVIDAGSLQMMELEWLKNLDGNVILTPHHKEFQWLFGETRERREIREIGEKAKEYNCTILLKGKEDIVCSTQECVKIYGGNEGMTKGGTGDVLAGLTAALYCKNSAFLAACCASFINKKAGDELYKRVGPFLNASDLVDEIPKVMHQLINK